MSEDWNALAEGVLDGETPSREAMERVLSSDDDELLPLLAAAFRVRRAHHGREVRVHVLQNAKSGVCPEDCSFCSQSLQAATGVERYGMQGVEELVEGARAAHRAGAVTYCMVTATRGPSSRELETVCEAARRIKAELPLSLCASLGILKEGQAEALAASGVDRFNHNLETSERHFPSVCTTHDYADRVRTVKAARAAGLEACCGGIYGLGEGVEDRVELAFALRALEVESIPVNFLDPRPGTPLEGRQRLAPTDCLRALCMMRFVNPTPDIRVAGGREVCLGPLQPLALYPANSLFARGYLTTPGQGLDADRAMIEAAGFRVAEVVPA